MSKNGIRDNLNDQLINHLTFLAIGPDTFSAWMTDGIPVAGVQVAVKDGGFSYRFA